MDETSYRNLILGLPFGYAYQRLLMDDSGKPCDYEFIEANKAFRDLSGFGELDFVGRKASELIPGLWTAGLDWVSLYGEIAMNGGSREFEQYSQQWDKWFKIYVSSPEYLYFTTIIIDDTLEKKQFSELNHFFTVSLDLLCIADMEGNFLKVNKEWEHVLGFPKEELEGRKYLEFVHPDDTDATIEAIHTLQKQGSMEGFVNRCLRNDGSFRSLEWSSRRQGKLVFSAARDITEHLKTEQSLKQESTMLMNLLDSIPDLVFFKDTEGRYLGCNLEFSRYTGISKESLTGHLDSDFFPAETAAAYRQKDIEALGADKTGSNEEWIRYPDGTEQVMETKKAPLRDSNGKVVGLIGISRNIMARKKAELLLLEQEKNFHTFFDSLEDMVFVIAMDGKIIFANRSVSNKLGYEDDELSCMMFYDVHQAEASEKATHIFDDMLHGNTNTCKLPLVTRNGVCIPVESRIWTGKWNGEHCVFSVFKDLSELDEALDKFQSLFDFNPSLLAVLGRTGDRYSILDINQAFLEKTGFNKEEIIGAGLSSNVLGRDFGLPEKIASEVERLGCLKNIDISMNTKSGNILTGMLSGTLIENESRSLILIAISDTSAQKEAENNLRKKVVMESHIAEASIRFINLKAAEIDQAINESLSGIGSLMRVDRGYVFIFGTDYDYCTKVHEWCSPEITPRISVLQDIESGLLPWWMERMQRHENIVLPSIRDVPEEARPERGLLEFQQIRSIILVPMFWGGRLEGFIGFDSVTVERHWNPEDIAPLELLSSIIISAMKRKESERELQRTQDSLKELNASLEKRVEERTQKLLVSLANLKETQQTMMQQEKLASLGQLAAGVAHEINNPTGYIMSNLFTFSGYFTVLTKMVDTYTEALTYWEKSCPPEARKLIAEIEEIKQLEDYNYIRNDGLELLKESIDGTNRIKGIVVGL